MAHGDDTVRLEYAITLSTRQRVALRHTVQAAKGRTVAAEARRRRSRLESLRVLAVKVAYWDKGVLRLRAGGAFAIAAMGRLGAFGSILIFGVAAWLVHSRAV